jgi:beta-lactamase regulating signal transducer with metallopeptidase domain
MTAVAHWFSPDVLRTLGLSLLHFLWQGAALAALATALIAAARQASTRYAIAVGALVLMVAAPVVTYFVLHQDEPAFSASKQAAVPTIAYVVNLATHRAVANTQSRVLSGGLLTIFVELWFIGVMLFSLRTAGGFFLIARLRRRESKPMNPGLLALCREMQHRLGISRAIRYCESLHLDAPAVVGWFRPVVLLPISALSGLTELQLRAVVAHELAHIRRLDAFFNLFQVVAETLLFYHPAVWWLSKRIRAERENCCDDVALSVCRNPAEYARALALMEQWRTAPTFAMAANRGPLASRVTRLLGLTEKGSSLRNAGVAFGVLCLAAALIAGNALFGVVRTASAHSFSLHQSDDRAGVIVVTAPRPSPQAKPSPKPTPTSTQEAAPAPKSKSYIEGMKAEGFDNLSADDLIAMKIQGITPEYIHEIRAEGFKPSPDELVAMKVQGITPEYIHEVRAMKLNVDVDSLIGMKVQGITPEYVDQLRKLGFQADTDQLIGMKVQGITPQYVDEMRKLGFQPDTDQLIGMKVQGITPQYVDEMRKLGFQPDTDQLIGMKVQGITPEYVQQLRDLNIHPDADDLIGMKVQGIDANYVRTIRATGLNPDKDEWVALKVQGVNGDFIKGLQAAGFKPDVDEVVAAKVMGITPQFIELARSHGFKNLDLNKLIQLKHANVLE